ncbi:unnamed protein product [Phytophthora lilii]|uniref:Unnamed protein product n=1 Tax=Phytophthora lilii TaxID=2077276 RepID=A0A9W6X890_9STRA|nr:unnamed protein product [Phytophthora lilii]
MPLSTVPVDDAIRTLSSEMAKDKDVAFIGNDSWNEEVAEPGNFASKASKSLPPVPRRNNDISSSIPPITGLDTPRGKKDSSDWQQDGQEAFGKPNDSGTRSPFFFGMKPPSEDETSGVDDRDAPLSRDPYAHYSRDSRRPGSNKNAPPLRHDEDDYFFGVPSESDAPAKPTTWEEIRRRAAEQRK